MFGIPWGKRRRRRGNNNSTDLQTPLIELGKGEPLTIGDSFEGISIMGGPGSGKTSASGYQISRAMLEAGYGGLVLTAKVDEADRWLRLAKMTHREDDVIFF